VQFARSSVRFFQKSLSGAFALALHAPVPVPPTKFGAAVADAGAGAGAEADRDVGRLFVGCGEGVHAFDLAEGKRSFFQLPITDQVTGLAVEDGKRLFALTPQAIFMIDTHSGAVASLWSGAGRSRTSSELTILFGMGCVLDLATRSLVLCDYNANTIVRARGVDV
jgi:hypothetical protein